jgi:hypothetical protein
MLTLAGSYAISASIGNQMVPGWPLAVHVQPAGCCATKCWLSGPAMQVQSHNPSPDHISLHQLGGSPWEWEELEDGLCGGLDYKSFLTVSSTSPIRFAKQQI